MAKNSQPPCKDKACGHSDMKHDLKRAGNCLMRGCPCVKYKS